MKIFSIISAALLMACHTQKPMVPTQGIAGYVYRETGNQMPSPNRAPRKPKGIKCDLYIYQPTTLKQTTGDATVFTAVSTKLITIAHTDSAGHYSLNLPVGKYSVFIRTDKGTFFADESDGEGILNPVEVMVNKVTDRNFKLRIGAVY
ncbi:hypothetical protein [Mucilaginibacter polytrichastri]|uniref:Carboxypeptidase regulatory-like domain-containing protein n=1 Tax=Mucilaginibacter polytrichastri TaxID=1302689 RepID=A0A1Q6A1R9_9SPHI|nr:hypothetical protein [Mucilaginibacter polytrichastri]OKS87959.1 hypothetical protein RG47T_3423 [Mucilaginibacter polytrichastri]SFT23364.1 hypothetical protein SAMN04487890_12059 [Mucilaginibacter polytrichastri]